MGREGWRDTCAPEDPLASTVGAPGARRCHLTSKSDERGALSHFPPCSRLPCCAAPCSLHCSKLPYHRLLLRHVQHLHAASAWQSLILHVTPARHTTPLPPLASLLAVDALALLRRSELLYHRLLLQHVQLLQGDSPGASEEEVLLREFVVCVRRAPDPSSPPSAATSAPLSDWLPVAELALVAQEEAAVVMPIALRAICR